MLMIDRPDGSLTYERSRPSARLADLVEHYWVIRARVCRTAVERALPDTGVDLYFNLGPHARTVVDPVTGEPRAEHRTAWVVGPHGAGVDVAKETVDSHIVGVHLRPGAATALLGVPAAELAGQVVDLSLLWGRAAADLRDSLGEAPGPAARVARVDAALARRAANHDAYHDAGGPSPVALFAAMARSPHTTVAALARASGLSHRRLIALFDRHAGLKPKTFQRVHRLRDVLRAEDAGRIHSWSALAHRLGYYDQAHLINEFRRLAGMTPEDYARVRSFTPGFVPVR
jgi:AraC-like DNA-binding protein